MALPECYQKYTRNKTLSIKTNLWPQFWPYNTTNYMNYKKHGHLLIFVDFYHLINKWILKWKETSDCVNEEESVLSLIFYWNINHDSCVCLCRPPLVAENCFKHKCFHKEPNLNQFIRTILFNISIITLKYNKTIRDCT